MLSKLPLLANEQIRISQETFEILKNTVEKILKITQSSVFKAEMDEMYFGETSFFPKEQQEIFREFLENTSDIKTNPMPRFASFDFHGGIEKSAPKLIEFSFFPAGLHFYTEDMGGTAVQKNYEQELLQTCEGFERIGIIDDNIGEQHFVQEFLSFRNFLQSHGKTVFLAEAETIQLQNGKISLIPWQENKTSSSMKKKENVDFLYNRLPFSDFLKDTNRFMGLLEIEKLFPERLSTTYKEWLYSEKCSLLLLQKEKDISSCIPKTIASFFIDHEEEIKQKLPGKIIAKPLFSYGGKGVFPRPSHPTLQKIFDEKIPYLFQELCPPYYLEDGRKYDIRLLMINGKISSVIARVYSGSITNFRSEGSGICRVEVE